MSRFCAGFGLRVAVEEQHDAVVEQASGGDGGLVCIELGGRDLAVGIDEGLLVYPSTK